MSLKSINPANGEEIKSYPELSLFEIKEILNSANVSQKLWSETKVDFRLECLKNLSNASAKIAEGEVMQLIASDNIKTTEDQYMKIIESKTAELFSTACVVGALIAKSKKDEINALISFGKNLGIAFQLKDDALDYSGEKDSLGKNVGEDFLEGKFCLL